LTVYQNNLELTKLDEICNGFNEYFSTVSENLVKTLTKNTAANVESYKKYCCPSLSNSMFCEPVQKAELTQLINNLNISECKISKIKAVEYSDLFYISVLTERLISFIML
jgi:hypothetical protein